MICIRFWIVFAFLVEQEYIFIYFFLLNLSLSIVCSLQSSFIFFRLVLSNEDAKHGIFLSQISLKRFKLKFVNNTQNFFCHQNLQNVFCYRDSIVLFYAYIFVCNKNFSGIWPKLKSIFINLFYINFKSNFRIYRRFSAETGQM